VTCEEAGCLAKPVQKPLKSPFWPSKQQAAPVPSYKFPHYQPIRKADMSFSQFQASSECIVKLFLFTNTWCYSTGFCMYQAGSLCAVKSAPLVSISAQEHTLF
jgi:hypothetical protein